VANLKYYWRYGFEDVGQEKSRYRALVGGEVHNFFPNPSIPHAPCPMPNYKLPITKNYRRELITKIVDIRICKVIVKAIDMDNYIR
jgi:hypothetical protein